MTEESEKWGYTAGPNDLMKQEIGQVVINHALCDEPLLELFIALTGTPASTAYILAQSLNLKAGGMTKAILDLSKAKKTQINEDLCSRLSVAIADYRKLSLLRNKVAHWQWYPSDEGAGSAKASKIMRRNNDDSQVIKEFTLYSLKQLSVGLIITYSALKLIAGLIPQNVPSAQLAQVFTNLDNISRKVKDAMLTLPEPSAEELP